MSLKLIAAIVASTFMASAAAQAGTVIVSGDADIFAAGLSSVPNSAGGGGSLPPSYAVVAGQTLDITATGLVNCCDTTSMAPTGPDGFASNPFGSGTSITNSTGSTVSGFTGAGAFPLVATFANASGAIGGVFQVGSSDFGVAVPTGATELYFGLPDASGFNGPSGYYADNSGSLTVSVSAAPEPSTWLLMIAGIGAAGMLLGQAKRETGLRFRDTFTA